MTVNAVAASRRICNGWDASVRLCKMQIEAASNIIEDSKEDALVNREIW
jgi:hypothetical protein